MTMVATPDADLAAAIERAGTAKSSFYTAMKLLPAERRHAMFAIYAFCRDVDDIADEPAPAGTKSEQLDLWRGEIDALYAGRTPSKPLARALAGPIRRFDLLHRDFAAVIDGMAMDAARDIQAPDLVELDLYCARVAGAVGRLSVRVFGASEPRADDVADHLGRALQLTNILRDLDEDAERGRLYLPRELLVKHGIDIEDPATVLAHPALSAVCTELAALARQHYRAAKAAMAECRRAPLRPARVMAGVYRALLDRLERRGWAAPRAVVKVPKRVKLWIAFSRGVL
jgi:presqualene diphosphate synthase